METVEDDFSIYNINSILNYIQNNLFQILLFILVFLIIYIVHYISNINSLLNLSNNSMIGFNNSIILVPAKKTRKSFKK
jgi:flagellar biogenesis protein FliO